MKKLSILFTLAIAVIIGSSCTAQAPKAKLNTEIDSLSYAIGLAQTQGLRDFLIQRMNIDTAYIDEFVKGFIESVNVESTDKKKNAYLSGLQIGQQIGGGIDNINMDIFSGDSTKKLNKNDLIAGFVAGAKNKDMKMDVMEAQTYAQQKMDEVRNKALEEKYAENKENGIKFLEENKNKEGVVTLPSGLQYKVIKEGNGPIPTSSDRVKVLYKGTLIDGTEFDNRNEVTEFGVTQVVPGWTEALQLMPVGSKWEVYIPSDLAYGAQDRGTIKPYSTLVFEMELMEIVKK